MNTALPLAYASVGLIFWMHSLYWLAVGDRRRGTGLGAADQVVLGAVSLVSSAAWLLLLPVYAAGWLQSETGRGARRRLRARVTRHRSAEAVPSGC